MASAFGGAQRRWVDGFSKLSKEQRRRWTAEAYGQSPEELLLRWRSHDHAAPPVQATLDKFAENTIANFPLPLGVAPNFSIDGELYALPMAVEESSVVAAASAAAKYWGRRGGFRTEVLGVTKVGQLFFDWHGAEAALRAALPQLTEQLHVASAELTANMRGRGGGILGVELLRHPGAGGTYELQGEFDTRDSMGANFINSVLESWGQALPQAFAKTAGLDTAAAPEVVMAILSNYTPECLVRAEVGCAIDDLGPGAAGQSSGVLAEKFCKAVDLAWVSPHRATTHNKGIYNGIDAVVIATGNDFRAVEACGHAYAARDGQYRSLSRCSLDGDEFRFWLEVPMSLGTVGGLTTAHPLAATSLELLQHPDAEQLMRIVGAAGLAQNFAAVRSLVTTGIQAGHMRMHLQNILMQLGATASQIAAATSYFAQQTVSYARVREYLDSQAITIGKNE